MTLDREVAIGKLAARLQVRHWRDDGHDYDQFESGARAGLTHMWPLFAALGDIAERMEDSFDTHHDPGAAAVIRRLQDGCLHGSLRETAP